MKRRRKTPGARLVIAVAVIIAAAIVAWSNLDRLVAMFHREAPRPAPAKVPAAGEAITEGAKAHVAGTIEIGKAPRDAKLGIEAPAAVLFRDVEMFEWREICAADNCRYELDWSPQPIDSHKFRQPAGHENPPAPFANARFDAADIRVGGYTVDPAFIAAQGTAVALPVNTKDLPPNLAATFRAVDGILYAGGAPDQPQVGTLRVSYRIVPLARVSLSGIVHGNHLSAE